MDGFVKNRVVGSVRPVRVQCNDCSFTTLYWEDGRPRRTAKSVPLVLRKYYDLYHFDTEGFPIWELIEVEHMRKTEKALKKEMTRLSRRVDTPNREVVESRAPTEEVISNT